MQHAHTMQTMQRVQHDNIEKSIHGSEYLPSKVCHMNDAPSRLLLWEAPIMITGKRQLF